MEIESEESYVLGRGIELKVVTIQVFLEVECKIHNRKIENLKLENLDFE